MSHGAKARGNLLGGFPEAAGGRKGEAYSIHRETWMLPWGARALLISRGSTDGEMLEAFKHKTEEHGPLSHELV